MSDVVATIAQFFESVRAWNARSAASPRALSCVCQSWALGARAPASHKFGSGALIVRRGGWQLLAETSGP
jgi:hypothetical protein